jgi:hypothetical protein
MWMLSHDSDKFKAFLQTEANITNTPITTKERHFDYSSKKTYSIHMRGEVNM